MRQSILRALSLDDPLHITEIADRIDEHPITVDQACSQLHDDEYITTIGGGRYCLTDDGQEFLHNGE